MKRISPSEKVPSFLPKKAPPSGPIGHKSIARGVSLCNAHPWRGSVSPLPTKAHPSTACPTSMRGGVSRRVAHPWAGSGSPQPQRASTRRRAEMRALVAKARVAGHTPRGRTGSALGVPSFNQNNAFEVVDKVCCDCCCVRRVYFAVGAHEAYFDGRPRGGWRTAILQGARKHPGGVGG